MRMSCNGCRVLRKGCSADCTLGPCLQWINSSASQANATLFLAKFYGRAGLFNLINAGPSHLRPEIFRSLLFEACGRIINPVYGAAGLMCSGDWTRCQAAVEAVLAGAPLVKQAATADRGRNNLQVCDIRHLPTASLRRARGRKRGRGRVEPEARFGIVGWAGDRGFVAAEMKREPSHDSFSVETVEPSLVTRAEQAVQGAEPGSWLNEIGLELTLGRDPVVQTYRDSE